MGGACTKPSDDIAPKKNGSSISNKSKKNLGPVAEQLSDKSESEDDFDPALLVPITTNHATPKINLLTEIIRIGHQQKLPQMDMLLTGITRIEDIVGISVKQYLNFEIDS